MTMACSGSPWLWYGIDGDKYVKPKGLSKSKENYQKQERNKNLKHYGIPVHVRN